MLKLSIYPVHVFDSYRDYLHSKIPIITEYVEAYNSTQAESEVIIKHPGMYYVVDNPIIVLNLISDKK